MEIEVPSELNNSKNTSVLAYLKPLSCHGDIIEPIYGFLKNKEGVKLFSPDPQNFKYCFWYVEDSIFAFGSGMQHIGLLLSTEFGTEAISCGAIESKTLGTNWFLFPYNHVELSKWVALALASAKSS